MVEWFTSADPTNCVINPDGFTITKEASDTYDVIGNGWVAIKQDTKDLEIKLNWDPANADKSV